MRSRMRELARAVRQQVNTALELAQMLDRPNDGSRGR